MEEGLGSYLKRMCKTRTKVMAIVVLTIALLNLTACATVDSSPPETNTYEPVSFAQETSITDNEADGQDYIEWYDAQNYIGEYLTVHGVVAGTHYASSSNGAPTFINVGSDYPDTSRLTVLIWGQYRYNFPQEPELMYDGMEIFVTGFISEYEGVAQIEVTDPEQIEY